MYTVMVSATVYNSIRVRALVNRSMTYLRLIRMLSTKRVSTTKTCLRYRCDKHRLHITVIDQCESCLRKICRNVDDARVRVKSYRQLDAQLTK
jgi:membrane-bound inhibitor of C-type lysozyme